MKRSNETVSPSLPGALVFTISVLLGAYLACQIIANDECPRRVPATEELAEISRCYSRNPEKPTLFELPAGQRWLDRLQSLTIGTEQIPEATYVVTRLLTLQMTKKKSHLRLPNAWLVYKRATTTSENSRAFMRKLEMRAQVSQLINYLIVLYGTNYRAVRPVVNYILENVDSISTLDLIIERFAKETKNIDLPSVYRPRRLGDEVKETFRSLFNDQSFISWLKSKTVDQITQLGGYTNTIVGVYDWIAYPEFADATGFNQFSNSADQYYDLGGGFATPDISRVLGHSFTSYDLLSPIQISQSLGLTFPVIVSWSSNRFGILETRRQTEAERESYFKLLQETPWVKFDVFKDHFPTHFKSYFITSFGFMSSTVKSLSNQAPYQRFHEVEPYDWTSYMAVRRVIELVALGKDVDLFTYQRASERVYRFRTVFLSFRDHRLVASRIWPKGFSGSNFDFINANKSNPRTPEVINRRDL